MEVVVFILFIAVLGYGLQYVDNKTEKANVSDESSINDWKIQVPRGKIKLNGNKYEYYHDFENYLLIGTDATGNNKNGADYQGSMADFLMLVIVDKTENTYSFLQFNRDTMTEVALIDHNGEGEATANIQLCTAHWYGGNREQSCENTVKSVKKLLGRINSMVDGVTVTLEDDFSKKYPKMKKGATINLDDEQAYAYVHDRYGVGDEENTSRMKRQQQYMTGFFKKLQEKVKANPNYANEVFESLQDVYTTDINIGKIYNISNIFDSGTDKGIFQLAGKSKIGQALGDEIDHMEFYVNKKAMVSTMSELFGIVEQKNKE